MAEAVNYPLWLHDLTNTRLTQLIGQKYEPIGTSNNGVRLHMGNTFWDGPPGSTPEESRNNVALIAYRELSCLPAGAMRARLGVTAPKDIKEVQTIRSAMNQMRARIHKKLDGPARAAAMDRWCYMWHGVDALEQMLRCFGFEQ